MSERTSCEHTPDELLTVAWSRVVYPVTALGPGTRVGIWLQGCDLACVGCVSRDTWDPEGGTTSTVPELIDVIDRLVDGRVDGVTISGGEPFSQPDALTALVRCLREWAGGPRVADEGPRSEFDVLCYSGHRVEWLRSNRPAPLAEIDALIDGRFVADQTADQPWRGSANQRLLTFTPLGTTRYESPPAAGNVTFQLGVAESGQTTFVGIPRRGDLERLEELVAAAGVTLEGVSWRA